MWKLLQKLEDLGWKPYGKSIAELTETEKNVRLLTSRSSGLWQFVCENGMIPKDERVSWRKIDEDGNYINHYAKYREKGSDVEYRLIEGSLKDESGLESFILENIKIDE